MLKIKSIFFHAFGKSSCAQCTEIEMKDLILCSSLSVLECAMQTGGQLPACALAGTVVQITSFSKQHWLDWKWKIGIYSDGMKPLSCGESCGDYLVRLRHLKESSGRNQLIVNKTSMKQKWCCYDQLVNANWQKKWWQCSLLLQFYDWGCARVFVMFFFFFFIEEIVTHFSN